MPRAALGTTPLARVVLRRVRRCRRTVCMPRFRSHNPTLSDCGWERLLLRLSRSTTSAALTVTATSIRARRSCRCSTSSSSGRCRARSTHSSSGWEWVRMRLESTKPTSRRKRPPIRGQELEQLKLLACRKQRALLDRPCGAQWWRGAHEGGHSKTDRTVLCSQEQSGQRSLWLAAKHESADMRADHDFRVPCRTSHVCSRVRPPVSCLTPSPPPSAVSQRASACASVPDAGQLTCSCMLLQEPRSCKAAIALIHRASIGTNWTSLLVSKFGAVTVNDLSE
eukprot:2392432-Prymnesium_polylepis.1